MVGQKYENVELLRGLAALGICLYHYGHGFLPDGSLFKIFTEPLYLGVDVFLIITGFTLTLSLFKQNYTVASIGTYLKKRLARIEIPYYGSLLLVIGMAYGSKLFPQYEWKGLQFDPLAIGAHFLHLNDILGLPWLHEVYWTLAIQVQYYLFMSFAFIGLAYRKKWVNHLFLLAFFMAQVVSARPYFTYFSSAFIIGIVMAMYYLQRMKSWETGVWLVVIMVHTYFYGNWSHFVAKGLTIAILFFPQIRSTFTNFLGKISYSLYLTHLTIGWSFIGFMLDAFHLQQHIELLILVACGLSILFAWVFYEYVEKPSGQVFNQRPK
jgi:peptidoglycan/LPS O-acetylase OafA/YrhL